MRERIMHNEEWREYDFKVEVEFEGNYRMFVSNFGRVKTFNQHYPEGNFLKGSLQGGYPIVRVKLYKKKTQLHERKIEKLQQQIDELNILSKRHRMDKDRTFLLQIREKRDKLIQKRMKVNKVENLKRSINIGVLVHKAVAELFLEKPTSKDKIFVIHKDFDKENNHVSNLAWASQDDLSQRSRLHPKIVLHTFKRQFIEKAPNTKVSKLQEKDVLYIKARLKKGDTLKRLAQKFNVSDMQIHRIKTGENWSHIKLIEDIKE